jgi:hypothetical protein
MTEETEHLVLEMLRRMRASQERMELDVVDIKGRISAIEQVQGQMLSMIGGLGVRLDRIEERVARIERRLDLVEHH